MSSQARGDPVNIAGSRESEGEGRRGDRDDSAREDAVGDADDDAGPSDAERERFVPRRPGLDLKPAAKERPQGRDFGGEFPKDDGLGGV